MPTRKFRSHSYATVKSGTVRYILDLQSRFTGDARSARVYAASPPVHTLQSSHRRDGRSTADTDADVARLA